MNQIEQLQRILGASIPGAAVRLDRPDAASGTWWLDVEWQGRSATIEWRPDYGFGVSGAGGAYGEGPDQVLEGVDDAADAVAAILEKRTAAGHR